MVKPDGVHRGLIGEIIKRFEQKGYKLLAMKMIMVSLYECQELMFNYNNNFNFKMTNII